MSASTLFTCNSCVIQFKSSDLQRYHMKTEWHRYNLKRRVSQLPPITADQFAEKLQLSERERLQHQVDEFGFEMLKPLDQTLKVNSRRKKLFYKQDDLDEESIRGRESETSVDDINEFEDSIPRSKSPAQSIDSRVSQLTIDSEETNTDYGEDTVSEYGFTTDSNYASTEEENEFSDDDYNSSSATDDAFDNDGRPISVTECIYCGVENKEIENNVKHMFAKHGLYIPERSYLANLPDLLNFLIDTIVIDNLCFCCNFQGSSLESIRAHMNSKRHCRMPYESRQEKELFAEFYDFSSLENKDDEKVTKAPSKKTIKFQEPSDSSCGDESNYEFEKEDKSFDANHINSNYVTVELDESGLELNLPSGGRAGHRIGQRIYRQNPPHTPEYPESRRVVSAADKRSASGITEKQYKIGLKKMQQLARKAQEKQFNSAVKRMNFQQHYRDEYLQ